MDTLASAPVRALAHDDSGLDMSVEAARMSACATGLFDGCYVADVVFAVPGV